jgi:hypothetical protein
MDSIEVLIWRAQRDAAVIDAVQQALTTLRILRVAGVGIDVRPDIERLTGALTLLGFPGN